MTGYVLFQTDLSSNIEQRLKKVKEARKEEGGPEGI
jgi:hypothetical protein